MLRRINTRFSLAFKVLENLMTIYFSSLTSYQSLTLTDSRPSGSSHCPCTCSELFPFLACDKQNVPSPRPSLQSLSILYYPTQMLSLSQYFPDHSDRKFTSSFIRNSQCNNKNLNLWSWLFIYDYCIFLILLSVRIKWVSQVGQW